MTRKAVSSEKCSCGSPAIVTFQRRDSSLTYPWCGQSDLRRTELKDDIPFDDYLALKFPCLDARAREMLSDDPAQAIQAILF